MIKLENTVLPSEEQWKAIIRGMRNPMNSWDKSDSIFGGKFSYGLNENISVSIGPNDYGLMKKLAKAGSDHSKYKRMIVVYVDITAPLYWWKEFDTYKVGTVANSCSTMHKIHEKYLTIEDFSTERLLPPAIDVVRSVIRTINECGDLYLGCDGFKWKYGEHDKKVYWENMIQLLPSSYNQRRTVELNYEVLSNMYRSRKNHKLEEWRDLCEWIKSLPYSDLITMGENDNAN